MKVTFHRAFDMTADLPRALEDLCAIGVDRILTSGGAVTALAGHKMIAELLKKAQGRIVVMAGSGIKPENARSFIELTAAKEIHVGLRSALSSSMFYRNPAVSMGSLEGHEYQRFGVLESEVKRLCEVLAGIAADLSK